MSVPLRARAPVESRAAAAEIAEAYNGSTLVFRVLRNAHWGPELMNLGYTPRCFGLGRIIAALRPLACAQRTLAFRAIRLMQVAPGDRVVDIACGRGGSSHMIRHATPASDVQAIDLLPENIALAHKLFPPDERLTYQQGDAQNLPFGDARFERALCCEAAFHFPDRQRFVREAGRVLAPGGRLVVVDFVWRPGTPASDIQRPQTDVVRKVWQWQEMSTLEWYRAAGSDAGLRLSCVENWTPQVTLPLQRRMEFSTWMARRPWGRALMVRRFPLFASLTDDDWREFTHIVEAHRFVTDRTHYTAMVFDKPARPRASLKVVG